MARTISQIQSIILAAIAANPVLAPLNSISQTAKYNLIAYIIAVTQATEENLYDSFTSQVEITALTAASDTINALASKSLVFQYSSSIPQIIQFNEQTLSYYYPVINTSYQIIKQVAITVDYEGQVQIRVYKTGTTPLSSSELAAYSNYMETSCTVGLPRVYSSNPPDLLYCVITCNYQGSYASVISNNLLTSYNNYLSSLPFGGSLTIDGLLVALYNTQGVNTIQINNLAARSYTTSFGGGSTLVNNNQWIQMTYNSISGAIIDESSPNDFISNLTLIQN